MVPLPWSSCATAHDAWSARHGDTPFSSQGLLAERDTAAEGIVEAGREVDVGSSCGDVAELLHQLRGATQSLRAKSASVRGAVVEAAQRSQTRGEGILKLVEKAQHELCGSSGDNGNNVGLLAAAVATESVGEEIKALERRLEDLKLAEGERRRAAELQQLQADMEFESLVARVAAAEREEAAAQLLATGPPPELRAAIVAEEFQLRELRQVVALRRERQGGAPPPPPEEMQYLEWCSMLSEDRPEHTALCVVEAVRDGWSQQLRSSVAAAAYGSAFSLGGEEDGASLGAAPTHCGSSSQGLGRLNAELHGLGFRERARKASAAECLRKLSEEGPLRAAFAEIEEAFQHVENLRENNDALVRDLVGLRWHRNCSLGSALAAGPVGSPAAGLVAPPLTSPAVLRSPEPLLGNLSATPIQSASDITSAGRPFQRRPPATSPAFFNIATPGAAPSDALASTPASHHHRPSSAPLARGPRFRGPPLMATSSPQRRQSTGASTRNRGHSVANPCVGGGSLFEDDPRSQAMPKAVVADSSEWEAAEVPKPEENGLAQLLGTRRIKPGSSVPKGFEVSSWTDAPVVAVVEQPQPPKDRRSAPRSAAELAKHAAAKFAEPLSAVLDGGDKRSRASSVRGTTGKPPRASARDTSLPAASTSAAGSHFKTKSRSEWVTFEVAAATAPSSTGMAAPPAPPMPQASLGAAVSSATCMSASSYGGGFAPLDTVPCVFDQPPQSLSCGGAWIRRGGRLDSGSESSAT